MGENREQRLVSHPHNSSWRLSSLLWSVLTPCGPPAKTHDGKVANERNGKREAELQINREVGVLHARVRLICDMP